jgi:hypothetical protein
MLLALLYIGEVKTVFQSLEPFWSISQMSTMDGSPRLERQVKKRERENKYAHAPSICVEVAPVDPWTKEP